MPDCWLEVSIRKVLRPATSTQVFLGFPVSLSKAELVPKTPSCHYMLLMWYSRRKFSSKPVSCFVCVLNDHCHRVTTQLQLINIIIIIIIVIIEHHRNGSSRLRPATFLDNQHMLLVRLSALRTGRLYIPGSIPGTHFR
jgi:hypothetical protein